jgi:uncharacterized protein
MDESIGVEALDEMERVLREETLGYVGLSHQGEPYVVPVNYLYANGTILFHCGFEGKKIDVLGANPRVCFVVGRQAGEVREHASGTSCNVDNDSVICYGTARTLVDLEERGAALNAFNRRFHPDAEEISRERIEKCNVVQIKISEMTGRKERGGKSTHWRHTFPG